MRGGNTIDIKLIAKDLASKTIGGFRKKITGIGKSFSGATSRASSFMSKVGGVTAALTGMLVAFKGFNIVKDFLRSSVDEAANFQKAMTTLEIVAPKFGVSVKKAQEAATRLGDELRIGPVAAAESLQNLLNSGLSLPQAEDLLERFTNEAITGKRAGIGLAEAVGNLSFAYKTNESNLMDLSGISENFDKIIEDGRESLKKKGVAVEDITDEMAKYEGMIALTNLTLGSSEKFEGTYIDQKAEMESQMRKLKVEIGRGLMPIMSKLLERTKPLIQAGIEWAKAFDWDNLLNQVTNALTKFDEVTKKTFEWIMNNKDIVVASLGAIAIVIGVVAVKALVAFIAAAAPLVVAIAGIAAVIFVLRKAWQENWGDIQGKTAAAWTVIQPKLQELWEWLKVNVPSALQTLKQFWDENWPGIRDTLVNAWNTIYPVILDLWNWLQVNVPLAVQWLKEKWEEYWPVIYNALVTAWNFIQPILLTLQDFIQNKIPAAIANLKNFWDTWLVPIFQTLQGIWDTVGRPIFDTIKNILEVVIPAAIGIAIWWWNNILMPVFGALKTAWDKFGYPIFKILKNILEIQIKAGINKFIVNWNRIKAKFEDFKTWYDENLSGTVNDIIDFLKNDIQGAVNNFETQWNRLSGIINTVLGPLKTVGNALSGVLGNFAKLSGKKADSIQVATPDGNAIEGRASGGRFPRSPFLVGEEGPELIDPGKRMVYSNSDTRKKLGGGGNITINVNGYNKDPLILAKEIERVLARKNQNTNLGLNLGR